ncbi:hypothetical protein [Massilia sp. Mn16-1_5]|uniref:alginate O-acetyltransferase AlgX-related protein n=1 Tax=Massilia sp. Mn16-1_5 TaxID=2079199 RepID=UPI00109E5254|nr:hypothetical protein [Massilia sp. Mn16-1_5]THC40486.1 hypothetical protein C2862_21440 [Massilia sp. Mn16-1_5]
MTQFASVRKLPAQELHAWALDFPQAGTAARMSERGLYLQGWALGREHGDCVDMIVRTQTPQGEEFRRIPFNNARPDVIHRVLGAAPAEHPHLRCGFIAHLDPVPTAFTLGVDVRGQVHWLSEVTLDGEPEFRPQPSAQQVIQGTGGWLYLDNDTNRSVEQFTGRLTLDADGLRGWRTYLDACAEIAGAVQARQGVMIAASKEQVLPEHYPHPKGVLTVHEQVLGLARPGHRVLDTAALLRARADREQCFIRTDTHWTDRGAMYASLELLALLGLDAQVARQRWLDDVYYTMPFAGDLGVKLVPALSAPTEFLQAPLASTKAVFDNHLPNLGRVLVFDDAAAPWSSLLLFGASSAYPMLKYLKRLFRRIVFVHSAGNVDAEIVRHERPDYLVMQTTARFVVTPPDVRFVLRHAVAEKLRAVDAQVRARAQASSAKAAADMKNLPYCAMLDTNEH